MAKSKFTNEQVNAVMEERGINRKSALKFLNKDAKTGGRKAAPAVDVKKAAANDREAAPTMTPEARGKARAEGLRLWQLAGKPDKAAFKKVFGPKGVAWTWEARAKAVGLASAEECAEKFSKLLAKAAR